MENISFDSGMQQYRINGGGVLRFNPGDPNLYARFLESADKIREIGDGAIMQIALTEHRIIGRPRKHP